jgi:hypothetical protein
LGVGQVCGVDLVRLSIVRILYILVPESPIPLLV